jgi:predicted metal-dependent enzyme (double-stranded beta helix superfamily)
MATMTIPELVAGIKDVLARSSDADEITRSVAAMATPLAADKSWLQPRCYEADDGQGIGITVFHEEPDNSILVETVCWLPGRGVAPHDHQTWGVVIGLEGEERNVMWRREDDGSKQDYAKLEQASEVVMRNGDVCRLLPDEIHSVRNDGNDLSMSLHIYGRNLAHVNRSEFDPINSIQRPCPVRKRND